MQKVLNKTKFEQYHWHDSEIRSISIDRKNPGINDTIIFDMDWYERGSGILIFEDIYWMRLNLNFGVIAPECVDSAFIADNNDSDLIAFNHNWKERLTDLDLTCFVIKTISTGSEIKIIAKSFKVNYLKSHEGF